MNRILIDKVWEGSFMKKEEYVIRYQEVAFRRKLMNIEIRYLNKCNSKGGVKSII